MNKIHQLLTLPSHKKEIGQLVVDKLSGRLATCVVLNTFDMHEWDFYHMYILSDEAIVKGDIFVTNQYGKWELQRCQDILSDGMILSYEEEIAMFQDNVFFTFKPETCKKVISCSDKNIYFGDNKQLPQIPSSFINKYIKKRNSGDMVKLVSVGYTYELSCDEDERGNLIPDIYLKLDNYNTIDIDLISEYYSRDKVEFLCLKMRDDYDKFIKCSKSSLSSDEVSSWTRSWIEINIL